MRRIDRRRLERRRRLLVVAGLSFALGALAAVGLTSRLSERPPATAAERPASATEAEIAALDANRHAEPRGAERPGERGEPVPAATTGSVAHADAVEELRRRHLVVPVEGVERTQLRDTFSDSRGGSRAHEALDIMAPRHTPVRAVEDGRIVKLFSSAAGGVTLYQFDPTDTFCYYYAHLDRYAPGVKEGEMVKRGQLIGYVGSTGNASPNAPHLHFAIFRLTPERQWWKGEPVNPHPVLESQKRP